MEGLGGHCVRPLYHFHICSRHAPSFAQTRKASPLEISDCFSCYEQKQVAVTYKQIGNRKVWDGVDSNSCSCFFMSYNTCWFTWSQNHLNGHNSTWISLEKDDTRSSVLNSIGFIDSFIIMEYPNFLFSWQYILSLGTTTCNILPSINFLYIWDEITR